MKERRNVRSGGHFFAGLKYLVAFKTRVPKTIQYRTFKQRICLCGGLKTPGSILYTPVSTEFEGRSVHWFTVCLLIKSGHIRASSSVVEQGTFNPRVVGSIPTWLTYLPVAGTLITGRSAKLSAAKPIAVLGPCPASEPPSSRGPGHRPFKAAARVRIPLGAHSSSSAGQHLN